MTIRNPFLFHSVSFAVWAARIYMYSKDTKKWLRLNTTVIRRCNLSKNNHFEYRKRYSRHWRGNGVVYKHSLPSTERRMCRINHQSYLIYSTEKRKKNKFNPNIKTTHSERVDMEHWMWNQSIKSRMNLSLLTPRKYAHYFPLACGGIAVAPFQQSTNAFFHSNLSLRGNDTVAM